MSENGLEQSNGDAPRTFTTSRGYTVRFRNIAYLLNKLATPKIDPPTYEVKTKTGVTEIHAHDETTLKTDEERAAWKEYLARHNAAWRKYDLDFTRLILMHGVIVDMPADDTWVKQQEFTGIAVPTDPLERRWHWLETELVAGGADVNAIIIGVLAESEVSEEVLASMADSFRHPLGQNAAHGSDHPEKRAPMDHQPPVRRGTSRRQKRTTSE